VAVGRPPPSPVGLRPPCELAGAGGGRARWGPRVCEGWVRGNPHGHGHTPQLLAECDSLLRHQASFSTTGRERSLSRRSQRRSRTAQSARHPVETYALARPPGFASPPSLSPSRRDAPPPASGRTPAVSLSGLAGARPATPLATTTHRCRRHVRLPPPAPGIVAWASSPRFPTRIPKPVPTENAARMAALQRGPSQYPTTRRARRRARGRRRRRARRRRQARKGIRLRLRLRRDTSGSGGSRILRSSVFDLQFLTADRRLHHRYW
jgi:hypothetical protein